MNMSKKRIIQIVGIAVAALLLILVAIPFLIDVNSFRPKLEAELSTALGRQVHVGNLSLSILGGTVTADDLSIAEDPAFGTTPFITAKQLKAGVEVRPLIFDKALHVTDVTLEQPQINLLRSADGATWNFSSIGNTKAPKPQETNTEISVAKLNVKDGKLTVGKLRSAEKPQVFDKVNVEITDFSPKAQFPFTMTAQLPGGGDIEVKGKAGPMNATNSAGTPLEASIKINKLNLATSGFVDASTGIAGIADLDGTVASDGLQAKANGTVTVNGVKLAVKGVPSKRALTVKYAAHHDLKTQAGTLTQGDITMGKAQAHLTGNYEVATSIPVLNMKLNGPDMPIDEVEAILPAAGVVLPSGSQLRGGTLSISASIVGPADKLVVTGPVRISNTTLAGFNLGSKLSAVSALSGKPTGGSDTSIQNLSTNARVAPEGTRLDAINLTIPALGVVTGAGTVSPAGALNFAMAANLSGGAVGGAVGGVTQLAGLGGKGGSATSNIPFAITGTTSDPKFTPDMKSVATGLATSQLTKQLGGSAAGSAGSQAAGALGGLLGKKKN